MKIKATNVSQTGFTIKCPKCKEPHVFEQINFDTYMMNGDELDTFGITKGRMHPIFVCRNESCDFEKVLMIVDFM